VLRPERRIRRGLLPRARDWLNRRFHLTAATPLPQPWLLVWTRSECEYGSDARNPQSQPKLGNRARRDLEGPTTPADTTASVGPAARMPVDPDHKHREQDGQDESRAVTMQDVPREETGAESAADADQGGHADPNGIWSWQQKPSQCTDEQTDEEKDDQVRNESHERRLPPMSGAIRPRQHRSLAGNYRAANGGLKEPSSAPV
jgi:hypothetical protein